MIPARLAPDNALPPDPVPLPPPWPGRLVQLDGSGLYVRETPATAPDAEPAVYVHGLVGSSQNWTDLAGLLAHRLAGEAVDLPGCGRSDPAPSRAGYTQQALADRVVRWIEHSGRGPVHLFGNSLGGAVSVRVAAQRPDLVRSLTLVSPAMPVWVPARSQRRLLPVLVVPRADRLVDRVVRRIPPEQIVRGSLELCFGDGSRPDPQRVAEAVDEATYRFSVPWVAQVYVRTFRGLAWSYLAPGARSLWRLAAAVQAPTLVVWGDQDRLVTVRLAERTARTIPDSRLVVLAGVGHTAQIETPRIVARAVSALLDEVAAGAVV